MLTLYNSLSLKKQHLEPIQKGKIGMYSCGPTVYDRVHIGNLRAFLAADVLYRVLTHLEGYTVKWVMNITDIDDRMIDQLKQDYATEDPKEGLKKLADKNINSFKNDLKAVGVSTDAITFLRATEHIARMQHLIAILFDEGIAYISNGSVYFSIDRYKKSGKEYGKLVNLAGEKRSRVTDDQDQKAGVADFALWKAQRVGEPAWDFDLDGQALPGRPGWHIECSAMSTEELGGVFDIHTGGVDLKFPHHENEIAQCGGELANFFVHNEHVQVDSQKMSKSLGNFTTINQIPDPLAFRLLSLQAHYRSQMEVNYQSLKAANDRLIALRDKAARARYLPDKLKKSKKSDFRDSFRKALEDDINTPKALGVLAAYEDSFKDSDYIENIEWADRMLGLELVPILQSFTKEELDLQSERNDARKSGDYTRSDELRKKLASMAIEAEDGMDGSFYWRKTT